MEIQARLRSNSFGRLIVLINLVVIVMLITKLYEDYRFISFPILYMWSALALLALNFWTLFQFQRTKLLLLSLVEFIYIAFYSNELYIGHSIFFWIYPMLVWSVYDVLFPNLKMEKKRFAAQFLMASFYSSAGIQKLIGLYQTHKFNTSGYGLVEGLLSDIYARIPSLMMNLIVKYSTIMNLGMMAVFLLQAFAFLLVFKLPNRYFGAIFIVFHAFNSFVLGVRFFEAILALGLFFLYQLPESEIKKAETSISVV